jgi:riboflavin kinase
MKIIGVVIKGLGEGAFFMSMQRYQKEIRKKLGFVAYPGTLNIKVSKMQKDSLNSLEKILVEGFRQKNRSFGGIDCYKARINNINGAIIVPHMTKHKDVIEFIAPVHVKNELNLRDGSKIKVELI